VKSESKTWIYSFLFPHTARDYWRIGAAHFWMLIPSVLEQNDRQVLWFLFPDCDLILWPFWDWNIWVSFGFWNLNMGWWLLKIQYKEFMLLITNLGKKSYFFDCKRLKLLILWFKYRVGKKLQHTLSKNFVWSSLLFEFLPRVPSEILVWSVLKFFIPLCM
jgi:hypothetical protein